MIGEATWCSTLYDVSDEEYEDIAINALSFFLLLFLSSFDPPPSVVITLFNEPITRYSVVLVSS